jgi:hypothetical protein
MKYSQSNRPIESDCTAPLTIVETAAVEVGPEDETEQHIPYPNIDKVVLSPGTLIVNGTNVDISRREATLLYMLIRYAQLRGPDDPLYFPAVKLLTGLHCGDDVEAVYKVVNRVRTRLAGAKLNRNLIDSRRGHGYRVSTRPSNLTLIGFRESRLNGARKSA